MYTNQTYLPNRQVRLTKKLLKILLSVVGSPLSDAYRALGGLVHAREIPGDVIPHLGQRPAPRHHTHVVLGKIVCPHPQVSIARIRVSRCSSTFGGMNLETYYFIENSELLSSK